jgi:chromosome segregation ATPase
VIKIPIELYRKFEMQEAELAALKDQLNEYDGIKDQFNWQSEQNAQALHERDEEIAALKGLVREMGDELKEVRYALDYAMQYGYQPGTLRNDIEVTINRPGVRVIMEGKSD